MDAGSQLTFLVVDSEMSSLDVVSSLLQGMGHYDYLQAEEGAEAWALFKNFKIDFVISKYDMPEVNGLALLKLMRSHDDYASIPFLMISSGITAKFVAHAGRAGVNGILVHPFQDEVFKEKITEILEMELAPENVEADQSFKKGVELMKAGQNDEALKLFENILTIHEHPEVYYNVGYIKAGKGHYDEAVRYFRQATRIDSNFARAYKKMGEAYTALGKMDEAEKCFQKAGEIYMDRNEDNKAEEVYETVLKLKPDTTNVYNSLGIIYRRQGRPAEAEKQYQKALLVHPNDENVYYNLSRIYLDNKDFHSASQALNKALEINPDFSEARELARAVEMGLTLTV